MDDDRRPADSIAFGLQHLVEGLRDDMREDMRELRADLVQIEGRMTQRIAKVEVGQAEARAQLEDFARRHGEDHEAEGIERREVHGQFYDYIRKAELDQARRDGALGVARYSVELLSRNAPRLIAILATIAAAAGLATGSIDINIGR